MLGKINTNLLHTNYTINTLPIPPHTLLTKGRWKYFKDKFLSKNDTLIATDGSRRGKNLIGGGIYIKNYKQKLNIKIAQNLGKGTINEAELWTISQALDVVKKLNITHRIFILTDSLYSLTHIHTKPGILGYHKLGYHVFFGVFGLYFQAKHRVFLCIW